MKNKVRLIDISIYTTRNHNFENVLNFLATITRGKKAKSYHVSQSSLERLLRIVKYLRAAP